MTKPQGDDKENQTTAISIALRRVLEENQRLMTEAIAANTLAAIPMMRTCLTPFMTMAKTGIYYSPHPLMRLTGFSRKKN